MNSFISNKKEKSILDCFTYDLATFFFDDYEEIDSEETPATVMIVYEKQLPWRELKIFDAVQFRIFFDKESLTGSNPVNVKFISKEKKSDVEYLKAIVNKVFSIYGNDDFENGEWNEEDDKQFEEESYRRVWTIEHGESFVCVEFNEEIGITLNILFFNNLIKESEDILDIKH
ncbi:MAG: hypothetical protein JEZ09_01775 [Salinivirgaceae bacterium]|nr:hypothetical protein [Salinivirgaceae bacterium]